ncbi:hypothetical protein [Priestia megaterium]|uniref:hypothetical protein n=1 Tax=Priestia megaterium TaxID=1404 RepID=UPI0022205B6B|nr:hypothetical protein [Priestia megaterium]UYV54087.1 hypothetical protein OHU65_05715 [Priestia megaterium]
MIRLRTQMANVVYRFFMNPTVQDRYGFIRTFNVYECGTVQVALSVLPTLKRRKEITVESIPLKSGNNKKTIQQLLPEEKTDKIYGKRKVM